MDSNRGYKLSNQQEALLLAMMSGERDQKRGEVWFSAHFFFMALGIHWNSYYRRLMEDLCELGWMERQFYGGQWWYMLTDAARVNRAQYWLYASRGIRKHLRSHNPESNQVPLPGSDEFLDEELPI